MDNDEYVYVNKGFSNYENYIKDTFKRESKNILLFSFEIFFFYILINFINYRKENFTVDMRFFFFFMFMILIFVFVP